MEANDLILNALCDDYKVSSIINKELTLEIGLALKKALNEGFEKGKSVFSPCLLDVNAVLLRFGVKTEFNKELSQLISNALYRAFMDGYKQGKNISSLIKKSNSSENKELQLVAKLIENHSKPENLALLNYLDKDV